MGVRAVLRDDPARIVQNVLTRSEEIERRKRFYRRICLYTDNAEKVIKEEIDNTHTDNEVRARMRGFAHLAVAQAPLKRVVNETAKPVYAVPAIREIDPESQQDAYAKMALEVRLNERMDSALRRGGATNHAFVYTRYVERLDRAVARVITPDQMAVIPDPDDPLVALAYVYDRRVWDPRNQRWMTHYVYWDDEITFELDHDKQMVGQPRKHGLLFNGKPEMPFVAIHFTDRSCDYWDTDTGNDLVAGDLQAKIVELWKLRTLKSQSFAQMVAEGATHNMPKGQTLDPENVLLSGGGVTLKTLDNKTDVDNFIKAEDAIGANAAASRGVSRARMNQDGDDSNERGLMEWRADMMKIMFGAEHDQFRIMQVVSQEYPDPSRRISMDAKLAYVDFGEIQHRVDRKTQLAIRKEERSMGLRSWIDDILEDQPELMGNRENAKSEGLRNMADEAFFVEQRRALQIHKDATVDEAGQDARDNGSMGPKVRDGEMTKDQAALMGRTGSMKPAETYE